MRSYRHRDLSLVELGPWETLIIACDSSGSIGEKPMDALQVPANITGSYTLRVPLMEVLCAGGQVICITDAICCEMKPTGRRILEGMHAELALADVHPALLTGSTEENFPTSATGVGVTVIARCGEPRFTKALPGDLVACVGLPKVGTEINLSGDSELVTYKDIAVLQRSVGIRELIPCGSKGVAYEARQAAEYSDLTFMEGNHNLNTEKSAGPATCLVAVFAPKALEALQGKLGDKLHIIGSME